jgi:heme A synthase
VAVVYYFVRKLKYPRELQQGLQWLVWVAALQITLGILTILSYVNLVIALMHQANALVLFGLGIYFIHRLRAFDQKSALK